LTLIDLATLVAKIEASAPWAKQGKLDSRGTLMRTQATLLLPYLGLASDLRRSLDPEMSSTMGPHVTIIYDDEAPDADLLSKRLISICRTTAPIDLHLEVIKPFQPKETGLYVSVKANASFFAIRSKALAPPFRSRHGSFEPHVTILHPKSRINDRVNWMQHIGTPIRVSLTIQEISVVSYDGSKWNKVAAIPLVGAAT
jgi:2'-5' RNA ligase